MKTTTFIGQVRASSMTHMWPLVIGSRVPEKAIFFMARAF